MSKDNNWILDDLESSENADLTTIDDLKDEEERRRQEIRKSKPVQGQKRRVKRLEVEVIERWGKRGPVVLMNGQGPKARTRFNVELTAALRNKIDRKTIGPRGHVAALLIDWAIDELERQGKCIEALSIK